MKKVVTVIFSVIIIGITVIGCGFSKFEAETTGEKINKRIECLFYQLRRLAMVHTPQTGTPCTSTEHPIGSPYDKTEALFCFRRLPSSILYFSLPVRFVSLPAVSSWNTDTSYKLHGFLYPLHGL